MTFYDLRPIRINLPSGEPPAFTLYIHMYTYVYIIHTIKRIYVYKWQ